MEDHTNWSILFGIFLNEVGSVYIALYHFFQVYKDNELSHYIDGFDSSKSNWMRFVNPAHSESHQNLVACQIQQDIYFYTVRSIPADTELLVWYCKEFADRLNCPTSSDQIMQTISEYIYFLFV